MADLLHKAGDLPMLILCRRMPGRIHHLYTVFDERNPDATGNRCLICFTSEKQAKKKPPEPVVVSNTHEQGPVFPEDEGAPSSGKKRRNRKTKAGTWKAMESGEIAKVPAKKVLLYSGAFPIESCDGYCSNSKPETANPSASHLFEFLRHALQYAII